MSDYFFWIISGIAIGLIIYLGDKYIFNESKFFTNFFCKYKVSFWC